LNLSPSEDSTTLEEPYSTSNVATSGSNVSMNSTTSESITTNTISSKSVIGNNVNNTIQQRSKSSNKAAKKKMKLLPSAAMNVQKSLLRRKKMQMNTQSNHPKMSKVLSNEIKEQEFLMQVRKNKLELEQERHDDLKNLEMKKIQIEETKLKIVSDEGTLKREQIMAQTLVEKNKAMLVRMEIVKAR
jgi:hypothetical protein